MIFEVWARRAASYLGIAAELRPLLDGIDGFVSIERFESLSEPGKLLSLSFWRDEAAVAAWRNLEAHRAAQAQGPRRDFQGLPAAHRCRDPRLRHDRARRGPRRQP